MREPIGFLSAVGSKKLYWYTKQRRSKSEREENSHSAIVKKKPQQLMTVSF